MSEPSVLSPDRRALTVGLLVCVVAFAADGMGVVPALPAAALELDGLALFGWSFGAFMLTWLVGTVAGGQLADSRGPFLPMALGLSAFAAGLVMAACSRTMPELLGSRAVQGFGGGAVLAVTFATVARAYPDAMRPRMLALISTAWVLPALVGPIIAGTITERASWRFVFAGVVPLVVVAAVFVLPSLRALSTRAAEPEPRLRHASRVPSALRLSCGAALVLAAPSATPIAGLALAVAGVALFAPALRALLPEGTLVGRRGLPMGMAARAVLGFAFFGAESFVPLSASVLREASATVAGMLLTAASLGWVAASWGQDRLEARYGKDGRARRVGVGFLLIGVGVGVTGAGLLGHLPFVAAAVGWALAGIGMGTAYGALGLHCLAAAPPGGEGQLSSQLQIAEALGVAGGSCIGSFARTALAGSGRSPHAVFTAVFALSVAAALFGAATSGRLRREVDAVTSA